jgi:UDP-2,3-diacylglucosamine hydrolase
VIPLTGYSTIIYLGDWVKNFSYAVFDREKTELKFFEKRD